MAERRRPRVLGVALDALGAADALRRAVGLVEEGRGGLVVTLNPEMLMARDHDPLLRGALEASRLTVADGIGVVWAARRLGCPVPERVPGIELMQGLLREAEARRWPVYLLGARPRTVAAAVERMREHFPALPIAGWRDGFFPLDNADAVAHAVAESGARLLFLGMGVPREQHFWMTARERLAGVLTIGVGGSFDVWAGTVRRAPVWMQRLNLEWLYRLLSQPSRWRRQAVLPVFAWRVWRLARRRRPGGRGPSGPHGSHGSRTGGRRGG